MYIHIEKWRMTRYHDIMNSKGKLYLVIIDERNITSSQWYIQGRESGSRDPRILGIPNVSFGSSESLGLSMDPLDPLNPLDCQWILWIPMGFSESSGSPIDPLDSQCIFYIFAVVVVLQI